MAERGTVKLAEDKEFWKELLGSHYDEELLKDLEDIENAQKKGTEAPGKDSTPKSDEGSLNNIKIERVNSDGTPKTEPVFYADEAEKTQVYSGDYDDPFGNTNKKAEDFEVEFDFEREYEDGRANKPIKRNREKRTGCLGGILYFVFILAISLGLACVAWIAATDILALGKEESTVEITLPEYIFSEKEIEVDIEDEEGNVIGTETSTIRAADVEELTDLLYNEGLIKYKWLFKFYANFSNADEKVSPGSYELNTNYDYRALVTGMTSYGGVKVEIDVTIPEGYSMYQIFKLMEENGVASFDDLMQAAETGDFTEYEFISTNTAEGAKVLEGYLFPDTYTFYIDDDPERVIYKLLNNFEAKWTSEYAERANYLGYSVNDIVNIASMIEKEAGSDEERSTIASVIYNRLNSNSLQLLQIDATIFYAIEGTNQEFATDIDSPYNTYMYPGLPAGAISNPGIASIRAALYPDDTYYYYYALGLDGTHEFFEDYGPFEAFVNSEEYGG